jgi:5-methylcytosine-specific restriction protein A
MPMWVVMVEGVEPSTSAVEVSGSRGVLYRPCLERNCPNLTSGSRCALHARRSTDSRPSSSRRGYDRDYQRKRVALLGNGARCVYCGKPATTVDHVKPLR